ncbi:hypothetical protein GCM10023189_55080 [Nibrella saemangeumensis]|uniref:DUF4369 domain-containing protein n=2 Tax=Nibrella saemangeumensis TaxID=1084526 RepID=A0ABP8NKP7_9BACT
MAICLITLGKTAASPGNWNTGKLVLRNGTVVTGEINYNWKAEIVQLRMPSGTVKAYSAFQVDHFIYFDNGQNTLRKFVSIDYPVRRTLTRQLILEEFTSGPYMVYRRLRHGREPIKVAQPVLYADDSELVKDYDSFNYYVYTNNTFTNLDYFDRELWPQMEQEFGDELKQFIQTRQINISSTVARLMIISHYNYLKDNMPQAEESPASTSVIRSGTTVGE